MVFKKVANNKIAYYVAIVAFGVLLFGCNSANAATLKINSNSTTLSPGGIATLSIALDSAGIAINNAEAKIVFPADLLEVISVSKGSSIFSLWVEEPTYSNITGFITFNGGIPTPGFTGPYGNVLSVVVKAKKVGQADIFFSDANVYANDGFGTEVLNTKTGETIYIKDIPTSESAPSITALQITSPTHPSQELWYKDNSPIFRWKVSTGVNAIQTGIDNNISSLPKVTYSPAITEKTVKDLEDGIWYFKARARRGGEWGPVSTYIVRVDNTIPKKNYVVFSYDNVKKVLNINADIIDETSGLDYYEIYINGSFSQKVPPGEFVDGSYGLAVNTSGDNTVKLVAVDRAGNSTEALGVFKAMPGPATIPVIYFIIIILLIIIILVLSAFEIGRHYNKFCNKLKMRTVLVKGDNTKVLLLLKKRLEKHLEILQHTRHNRILSKEERDIKEAIEGDLDEVEKAIEEQKIV